MQKSRRSSSRMNKRKKIVVITTAIVLLVLAIVYLCIALYFKNHFFLRTEINGLKVGGLTAAATEEKIAKDVGEYLLTIYDRDDEKYHIMGRDINNSYVPDGSIGKALEEQKFMNWLPAIVNGNVIDVETPMTYEADKLKTAVGSLPCFAEEKIIEPEDAKIQLVDGAYAVLPEVKGNKMILEKVVEEVGAAINEGEGTVTLTDDVYVNPEVSSNSPEIKEPMETIERYQNASVAYNITEHGISLEKEDIIKMIQINEDGTVALEEQKITEFVQRLASKYNTYGRVRSFKTSLGDTIEIGGGDYGWVVDKEKEAQTLIENIKSGESITREPEYQQKALYEGYNDIGNTYLEIDYTNQHMWYYKDGQLVVEADVVTGNIARNNGSPDGVFKIVYKQSPAVLRGEDYESDVTYFMPFAYNVGVHDASWRSQFGGNHYKTSGSHGCINAPGDKAEALYKEIEVGTPVIAYYKEKIELTAENCRISNAYSYVAQ